MTRAERIAREYIRSFPGDPGYSLSDLRARVKALRGATQTQARAALIEDLDRAAKIVEEFEAKRRARARGGAR